MKILPFIIIFTGWAFLLSCKSERRQNISGHYDCYRIQQDFQSIEYYLMNYVEKYGVQPSSRKFSDWVIQFSKEKSSSTRVYAFRFEGDLLKREALILTYLDGNNICDYYVESEKYEILDK